MKREAEFKIAGILRIAFVVIMILLQISLIFLLSYYLSEAAIFVYTAIEIAAVIQIMVLVSRNQNSSYTIAWILVISFLPVFGHVLYLIWGNNNVNSKRAKELRSAIDRGQRYLRPDINTDTYDKLCKEHPSRRRMSSYLIKNEFPLYENTDCQYFSLGEYQYESLLEDLRHAEKFIFISTFILNTGKLWDDMREILIHRAKNGVDVRLIYDDFGSILTAPDNLIADMTHHNIKVLRFNPIHKYISQLYINYRNHQKICVVDGNIAYTGGTNISDEYCNYVEKHGHWKDTAIRLEGDAVWSMTTIFLQMWECESAGKEDYKQYRPSISKEKKGFFQPFADGPVNNPINPAESMYLSIITNAKEYVYITSPYLVINNNITNALCDAAQSGVDVRIVTPKKWDHWYVHAVSRSNYKSLLQAGVKIFEYTPGFMHAKSIVSDDDNCIIGSINMDYRSFYMHFENGVWICGDPVVLSIKDDILNVVTVCEEITLEDYMQRPKYMRFMEGVLRVFAVLF